MDIPLDHGSAHGFAEKRINAALDPLCNLDINA